MTRLGEDAAAESADAPDGLRQATSGPSPLAFSTFLAGVFSRQWVLGLSEPQVRPSAPTWMSASSACILAPAIPGRAYRWLPPAAVRSRPATSAMARVRQTGMIRAPRRPTCSAVKPIKAGPTTLPV